MPNILEPAIAVKIAKMKERAQWRHPLIRERGIDQTRLVLDDIQGDNPTFSFLVIGDSGAGSYPDHHPQRRIAEYMLPHLEDCRFLLHTGDVIYQIGSSEQYPDNFIKPYREWLVGGEHPEQIAYDRMVFKQPFLPVLGNHDYYDLPLLVWPIVSGYAPPLSVIGGAIGAQYWVAWILSRGRLCPRLFRLSQNVGHTG